MEKCSLCETELTRKNKPIMGSGKLSDGSRLCTSCYLSLSKTEKEIFINLKKYDQISLKDALKNKNEILEKSKNIIVTTGDLKQDYEIIGPIYFQVSNKGIFSSVLSKLSKKYKSELSELKSKGLDSQKENDWSFLYGEFSFGMANDFDTAFYISIKEMQNRAAILDADAIIGMKQDIDLDTNQFQYFYLQMYGTAVKFINKQNN
jgi:hypothetical protein